MKAEKPDEKTLRTVFSEILNGFTKTQFNKRDIWVKHFSQKDQFDLDTHREGVYAHARESGLPTEKETLELLVSEDIWSHQEEAQVQEEEKYVENLRETKKNLIIPSQIKSINEDIERAEAALTTKLVHRKSLLAETCESYARNKSNDYSIYLCLYRTEDLKEKFLTWDEFCEMPKVKLTEYLQLYVEATAHLSVENIKYLALDDTFSLYYNLMGSANLYKFFDKPLYRLSFYQLNLLNYAKVLHSILENVENVPDYIKGDPNELLDFAASKNKNKKVVERGKGKQGFSVVGATKKDMDEMGVDDGLGVDPFELAKEKGSLTIEDFQNFS